MARPKKDKTKEPTADQGVVLFTALSMILLAFFIMLFNMAVPDPARTHAALGSLLGTFGFMPGMDAMADDNGTPPPPRVGGSESQNFIQRLDSLSESPLLSGLAQLHSQDGRLALHIDGELLYTSGGWRLSPLTFPALDAIGGLIDDCECRVVVEGHTDDRAARGAVSNWYLSAARAAAVQRYLEATTRVRPGTIRAVGFGSTQPLEDRIKSRRVEIVFELDPY